jgi:ribonuclease-3
MRDLKELQKKIGVSFKDEKLLETALVHRSYLNENRAVKSHNERLEFLGDAVLELVVTDYLYRNYPNPEGDLTNWRSALVKTESISEAAKSLGYENFLLMSKGESSSAGRSRQLILANCFEAVIGAMYLDQGYEVARKFIEEKLIVNLGTIIEKKLYIDPKSSFQELAQDKEGVTPRYEVIGEDGPDHDKKFTIAVFVGDKEWGRGVGPSKQIAQQEAAKLAVKKYQSSPKVVFAP